jgi:hypothetical protein
MDKISFDILYHGGTNEDIMWSEVDAVLQSPRFSNLRKIQIYVITKLHPIVDPQVLASFPAQLSQCHARGILLVHSMAWDEPTTI